MEAPKEAGAHELIVNLKDGYDIYIVGWGMKLPGGQKQWLSIHVFSETLQYLMGHSDISVTMNVYTHIGFDDAEKELKRMEEFRKAQAEVEQKKEKPMSQKMFKVI